MSELKAFNSERIYWAVEQVEREAGDIDEFHLDDNLFYLKSEADKVIAEKDEKIDELEEERRWRKFPDEKPEEWETVVVRLSDGFYDLAVYMSNGQGWDIGDGLYHKPEEVSHWLPLP